MGKEWSRQERPGLEGAGRGRALQEGCTQGTSKQRKARCPVCREILTALNTRLRNSSFRGQPGDPHQVGARAAAAWAGLGRAPWWPQGARQEAGGRAAVVQPGE